MPNFIEKKAKSILRKSKITDNWFISKYNMNLYRGCSHACAYCDGRDERYYVQGNFGSDIEVKVNAPELVEKEILKVKEKSIIFLGGGVADAYQDAEKQYELTRLILKIISNNNFPVHILTKSSLIQRDFDVLQEINNKKSVIVSYSISTPDQEVADIFEPGCANVQDRFAILKQCKDMGFYTGIMYMPVIPVISDNKESFEKVLIQAKEAQVDFILFGGMTVKTGKQQNHLYSVLEKKYPGIVEKYNQIYHGNKWGGPSHEYSKYIDQLFYSLLPIIKIPARIPHYIYKNNIELNIEVAMILFHLTFFLKIRGKDRKVYEKAAWTLINLKEDIAELVKNQTLSKLPGVGKVISGIITEIVQERRNLYYEKLLYYMDY